jgi:hypothetical protein
MVRSIHPSSPAVNRWHRVASRILAGVDAWKRPLTVAAIAGLVTFGWLSLVAGIERRGLTWWDPLIIAVMAFGAWLIGAALRQRSP